MILDSDRNWKTRREAEAARQALEDARHARNARVAEVVSVAAVLLAVVFCLAVGARDGLFDFFTSLHF